MAKRAKIVNIIITLVLFCIAVLYIIPFVMMIFGSFKSQPEASLFDLKLPSKFLISNYTYVIENGNILRGYLNDFIITFPVTIISLVFGALAGIVLSRRSEKFVNGIYYYFIFGLTVTLQIASIFAMLRYFNIYGTFFAVICIFISLRIPFTVMTFCSFVKGVPKEIDEAAILDGCGFLRLCMSILLPILKPILITNIVITSIDVWNNFMIPLFYLGKESQMTVPLTIFSFFGRYTRDWQYVFSSLTLAVLPMLILFLFLQKYIVAGMTSGAVKG